MPIIISYDTSTSTKERWGYWLHEDNSSVYKTPLSESDFNDINYFVKDMSISIRYDPDDFDRTDLISDVFEEQNFEIYNKLSDFTHFYFLFEYSPDSPLQIDEMSEIMMKFFKLVIANDSEPKYYFFAAESRNKIANSEAQERSGASFALPQLRKVDSPDPQR